MCVSLRWLLAACLFAVSSADIIDCGLPKCNAYLPASVHDTPGVAFDLTPGYGVAAIRTFNHTFHDVAVIEGSPDYLSLMKRLYNSPAPSPSFYKRYLRRLRKALGKPATGDVGVLAEMLQLLRSKVDAHPVLNGTSIYNVAVAMPRFDAITLDDERDALDFVGLRSWLDDESIITRLSEADVAFAAGGNGLCKNYKNYYECRDEADYMPRYNVLTITFAKKFWHASVERMDIAFSGIEDRHMTAWDTAYEKFGSVYPPDWWYWLMVRRQMYSFLQIATEDFRIRINKVQLLGDDSTDDPSFHEMLKDLLWEVTDPGHRLKEFESNEKEVPIDIMTKPLWTAVRGAAIYAQRRQEAPYDCTEAPYCDEERH